MKNVPKEDFRKVWARIILDVICFASEEYAVVVDYKTGRKFGNEVDHARQGQPLQGPSNFLCISGISVVEASHTLAAGVGQEVEANDEA